MEKCRCKWCNLKNPIYVEYHDHEWGVPEHDDRKLFELLILESFQAGLSWECVLNKHEYFRKAFDGFDLDTVCGYGEEKLAELLQNKNLIRNKLKKSTEPLPSICGILRMVRLFMSATGQLLSCQIPCRQI